MATEDLARPGHVSSPESWLSRPHVWPLLSAAILALYLVVLHPWLMNWGATPEEQRMPLPGDEFYPNAVVQTTRAITIEAPREEVWAWLQQIGQDRAGFYSYDWLENLFFADMPQVDDLRPEWPPRQLGEHVPMALDGRLGPATVLPIDVLEPGRAIGHIPGAFVLYAIDEDTTRLLLRERARFERPGESPATGRARAISSLIGWALWDPMHFAMEKRMLTGIKDHAEGHPHPPAALAVPARIGWAGAGIGLLALFLSRRWWPWLILPGIAGGQAMVISHDPDAALAGFLAVGTIIMGFLLFGRHWWAPLTTVAGTVLLILLLARDAYIVFGFLFLLATLIGLARFSGIPTLSRGRHADTSAPERAPQSNERAAGK